MYLDLFINIYIFFISLGRKMERIWSFSQLKPTFFKTASKGEIFPNALFSGFHKKRVNTIKKGITYWFIKISRYV